MSRVAARLAARFDLMARRLEVLDRSADALGFERTQRQRLGGLVHVGPEARVIRDEDELLARVLEIATDAFAPDELSLTLVGQSTPPDLLPDEALRSLEPVESPDGHRYLVPLDVKRHAAGVLKATRAHAAFDEADRTLFSEQVRPDEVVAMLNTYFGAVVPVILDEDSTVVQFVGDAVTAVFNAPTRQPDHALRAARAGMRLQQATERVAAGRDDRPRFRVGINSGPALVGNVGIAEMRNFAAIGDTTNLAARLDGLADQGQVVIGSATRDLLGDIAVLRQLGRVIVKGKREPVDAFVLRGLAEVRR